MPIKSKLKGKISDVAAVGGGLFLPIGARIEATDMNELDYDVTLDVELTDGRYECVDLTCSRRPGGPPVTTNGIRSIPIGRLIEQGIAPYVLHSTPNPHAEGEWVVSPAGYSDDELVKVAAIYRLAYACGLPPTTAVANALGVTQSVAGNRVMKARRKEGLLDPTTKGKAKAGGST